MDTVLVTGGTGHLGKDLVALLKSSFRVRVLARTPGADPDVEWVPGDLAAGTGIREAVTGSQTVIHAATLSPAARRGYLLPSDFWRSPPDVDVDGTALLLKEATAAGVGHFAYISIVGVDQPRTPYLRLKHTAEEMVGAEDIPWSIFRATQFHWLLDRMLGRMARLPVVPLLDVPAQPVDSADFAAYVAGCVADGPGGRLDDYVGPEVLSLGEIARQWQEIRGRRCRAVTVPLPSRARKAAADMMTNPTGTPGKTRWADWLRAHDAE